VVNHAADANLLGGINLILTLNTSTVPPEGNAIAKQLKMVAGGMKTHVIEL